MNVLAIPDAKRGLRLALIASVAIHGAALALPLSRPPSPGANRPLSVDWVSAPLAAGEPARSERPLRTLPALHPMPLSAPAPVVAASPADGSNAAPVAGAPASGTAGTGEGPSAATAVRFDADYLSNSLPAYPVASRTSANRAPFFSPSA